MKKNIFKKMMEALFGSGDKARVSSTQLSLPEEDAKEVQAEVETSNTGWVSVDKNTQNIEKSKAAEAGIFSSDQLLRMFENIDDLVIFINKDSNIKYITPSIKDFLGYENKELIDKKFIMSAISLPID